MSDFRPMTECKGFNMERVLLKNKNGYMITAYFKDGMLKCDGDEDWTQPIAWKGFIRLQDLANGAPSKGGGLHLQRVSQRSEQLAIAALDKIAHPIKYLQEEAEKEGAKLNGGMAIQITQDANFYQDIADKALKTIANCG